MFINLINHLKQQGIKYLPVEDNSNVVVFGIKTDVGSYQCIADVKENDFIFIFYTIIGITVTKDKLLPMSEMITRINSGLMIGNFEMDFEDGELRYKTSIDFEGNELTDNLIHNVISANLATVDSYFKAVMALIINNDTPQNILKQFKL